MRTAVYRLAISLAGSAVGLVAFAGQAGAAAAAPALATAPGFTLSVAASGFGANALTVPIGETVSFVNLDDQPHQVTLLPASGSTCDALPLVIWPQTYRSCTFVAAGPYVIIDPTSADPRLRAALTVASPTEVLASVSVAASRSRVPAGGKVVLSGAVNVPRAGVQVDVVAQQLGTSRFTKVAQTVTTSGGFFSVAVHPDFTTVYLVNAVVMPTVVSSPLVSVNVATPMHLSAAGRIGRTPSPLGTVGIESGVSVGGR